MDNADREGPHFYWRRTLLLIGCQLASKPKVELPYAVVTGVVAPHGCEDLTNRVEVLLNRLLLDRFTVRGQKAGTDELGGNLEEGNGVFNVFEVGGNLEPAAEAPPLLSVGGVLLENGSR